ncbi:helix-turn-helix domain-containing protein [Streptococcus pneumoniae]|uniref:helix-turn-helix domain-containing protein n=1 Tax=Streptococcus pneumoniae TaxID=1313 RepID=UPI0005E9CFDB|nr:helix-turn-helix transcriptional regulator [Streptococcus pneumoniae]CNZ68560.1 transcriptional regulator [Streptococcus pneumoniae]
MEKFHEKLKMLRKKKGLTQQEVAELVHVERGVYTNWELGNRNPNYENLSMLVCIFDVSLDYLLGDYLEISKERYLKLKKQKEEKKEFIFSQTKRITFTAWI